jgi:signal transduction histidine kinase
MNMIPDSNRKPVVLVVDDDVTVRMMATEFLGEFGFNIYTAEDGKTAMDLFHRVRPECVLLDVMLPDTDGMCLCHEIRQLPGGELIPILIMTSLNDEASIHSAYEVGATEFSIKPMNWAIEGHRIRYMLRAAQTQVDLLRSEEQFRQAQKMEAVGRLAGGVAHDFNNLLTVIMSYSELILSGLREEDQVLKDVQEIYKAGDRAASLTRQLLAFSRKQVLKPQVVKVNQLVDSMSNMLARLIKKEIDFTMDLDERLENIHADPGQIEQVVVNLVVNASDAIPEKGAIKITTENVILTEGDVKSNPEAAPGPFSLITVSDTGTGMSRQTREQIFEPFFTTKSAGKGTGLGLSTVYGIVKQTKGIIQLDSEVGKGTTFRIYFPTTNKAVSVRSNKDDDPVPGEAQGTILLVEDETGIREVLTRHLCFLGYEVIQACNGRHAMEILEDKPALDMLITDLIMPEMGGFELVAQFKERYPDTRVVFMSGYSENTPSDEVLDEVRGIYLQKPFALNSFGREICEHMKSERRAAAAPAQA